MQKIMGNKNKQCCNIDDYVEGDDDNLHLKPLNRQPKKRLNSHMFEVKNNLLVVDTPQISDYIDFDRYLPKVKDTLDDY